MSSRNLDDAVYPLKLFSVELIKRAWDEYRIKVFVTSVMRTYLEQVALHAQGRLSIEDVNIARRIAGMLPIAAEYNKEVTWTLNSKHIINLLDDNPKNDKSEAVDYGILDKNGKYRGDEKADTNEDNIFDYRQLGNLGKKIALEFEYPIYWGGDWKKPDYPHWEYKGV